MLRIRIISNSLRRRDGLSERRAPALLHRRRSAPTVPFCCPA
jgi:hypothetical protein